MPVSLYRLSRCVAWLAIYPKSPFALIKVFRVCLTNILWLVVSSFVFQNNQPRQTRQSIQRGWRNQEALQNSCATHTLLLGAQDHAIVSIQTLLAMSFALLNCFIVWIVFNCYAYSVSMVFGFSIYYDKRMLIMHIPDDWLVSAAPWVWATDPAGAVVAALREAAREFCIEREDNGSATIRTGYAYCYFCHNYILFYHAASAHSHG